MPVLHFLLLFLACLVVSCGDGPKFGLLSESESTLDKNNTTENDSSQSKKKGSDQPGEGENNDGFNPTDVPDFPGVGETPEGLIGGHFDLDTATVIYPPEEGHTTHHVHEFDKEHETTGVDFFTLIELDDKFDAIDDPTIISPTKKFFIHFVNVNLSPGTLVEINGDSFLATEYQDYVESQIANENLNIFRLQNPDSGETQLTSLSVYYEEDVIPNGGLMQTATGCVRKNDPGLLGEYRNGALTIQILDADNYSLNPDTGAASSGLLWEATFFWHEGPCYGN